MADNFKGLFNPNLLSSRCAGLELSLGSRERAIIERWSRVASHPRFRQETERSTQAQFLIEIFGTLLGYTLSAGHLAAHHIRMETASREVKGSKTPDASLGFYGDAPDCTRAIIELKAPGADLDARQSGYGNITPVDQAFGYLGRFDDCRWAVVSNFVEIRLYSKTRGQGYAHRFLLAELADPDALRRFLFLLHRDQLLAEPPAHSVVDQLLAETHSEEEAITHRFYDFYRELRLRFFQALVQANTPPVGPALSSSPPSTICMPNMSASTTGSPSSAADSPNCLTSTSSSSSRISTASTSTPNPSRSPSSRSGSRPPAPIAR